MRGKQFYIQLPESILKMADERATPQSKPTISIIYIRCADTYHNQFFPLLVFLLEYLRINNCNPEFLKGIRDFFLTPDTVCSLSQ